MAQPRDTTDPVDGSATRSATNADGELRHYTLFETALGICGLGWSGRGLTRVQLPERDLQTAEARLRAGGARHEPHPLPDPVTACIALLTRYARGEQTDFSGVILDATSVPAFNAELYRLLRGVGWGETTTYGTLARLAGSPGAARAVGMAMGRNPWPIIVPCHRVLGQSRAMVGFSAYGGIATKQKLLQMEATDLFSLGRHSDPSNPE